MKEIINYSSNFSNTVRIRLDLNEKRIKYNNENFSPGKYKIPSLINKNGFIFQSNFKGELGRSFIGKNIGNSDMKTSSNLFFNFSYLDNIIFFLSLKDIVMRKLVNFCMVFFLFYFCFFFWLFFRSRFFLYLFILIK